MNDCGNYRELTSTLVIYSTIYNWHLFVRDCKAIIYKKAEFIRAGI